MNPLQRSICQALQFFGPLSAAQISQRLQMRGQVESVTDIQTEAKLLIQLRRIRCTQLNGIEIYASEEGI